MALSELQILALDLGTDILSAVALGAERPGRHFSTLHRCRAASSTTPSHAKLSV